GLLEVEDAGDRCRDVCVAGGKRVIKARLEVRSMGRQGNMRIGRREAAVVAPAVDRARVADSWMSCDGDVFVESEADDDVRRAAGDRVLRLDEAHGQRPRDLPI